MDGSILTGYLDASTVLVNKVRFAPQQYGIATKLSNKGLAGFVDALVVKWLGDGTIPAILKAHNVPPSFTE